MKILKPSTKKLAAASAAVLCVAMLGSASADATYAEAAPAPAVALSTIINFEIIAEPCVFATVNPLRERYSGLGVHFSGPSAQSGAAILDECSGFGVDALSGEAFLAVNADSVMDNGGVPKGPITVRSDDKQRSVGIWVSAGQPGPGETFKLVGKRGGNVIASDSVTTGVSDFKRLRVSSANGFSSVILRAVSTIDAQWVADDLEITRL